MQNHRQIDNTSRQNEHLYLLKQLDSRGRWNRGVVGDYYIRHSNFKREFTLSKTKLDLIIQYCIIVVDESVREVLENIDWNRYAVPSNHAFTLGKEQLHQAFNGTYNNERHKT